MDIEVLVATMNKQKEDIFELKNMMNIKSNSIFINQITKSDIKLTNIENDNFKVISKKDKGLSKSRNLALKNASSDIVIIADDDVVYEYNYVEVINKAYNKYKDADIIAFNVISTNKERPLNILKEGRVNFLNSMKLASVQITYKLNSIRKNNIMFNEDFGAGSEKYTCGEENIFLTKCLKKKLKIYYCPIKIAIVNQDESTWYNGFDKNLFITKGAMFFNMSKKLSFILNVQFLIRKYKYYKDNMNFKAAYHYMKTGKKIEKEKNKNKKRIFFVGDIVNNTGPAIVNKNIVNNIDDDIKIVSIAKTKLGRIIEVVFKELKADKILICSFSKLDKFVIQYAMVLNKDVFYLMHGWISYENKINGTIDKSQIELEQYIFDNVTKIFCVSENFMNIMKKNNKAIEKKFDYIRNGIDVSNIKKLQKDSDRFEKNKNLIMSTGGGLLRKNNLSICMAIDKLNREKNMNFKYIVCGKKIQDYEKIIKYYFVEFYEDLCHEETMKKMQESYLYIQNSSFETFGLAVIESIYNNCNLLISNNIGSKEIINALNEDDIINDINNIDEISDKILKVYKKSNNFRLKNSIDLNEIDVTLLADKLVEKINRE